MTSLHNKIKIKQPKCNINTTNVTLTSFLQTTGVGPPHLSPLLNVSTSPDCLIGLIFSLCLLVLSPFISCTSITVAQLWPSLFWLVLRHRGSEDRSPWPVSSLTSWPPSWIESPSSRSRYMSSVCSPVGPDDVTAAAAAAKQAWYNQRRQYRQLRHRKSAGFWS